MNLIIGISSVAFIISVLSGITGTHSATVLKNKPPVAFKICPKHQTMEVCIAEAREASESLQYCHYLKPDYNKKEVHYISCGSVQCNKPYVYVKEDLSQTFPLCCARCVHIPQ